MMIWRRSRTALAAAAAIVVAILAVPARAAAQDPPESRREGIGVGVLFTVQAGVGNILSVRLSTPAGRKAGFDLDVGWAFGGRKLPPPIPLARRTDKPIQFRWLARGLTTAAHVRWLPRGRRDTGWSTALIFGTRLVQGRSFDADNSPIGRYWTKGFEVGIGVDRVLETGHRVGGEFGSGQTLGRPPAGQQIVELSGPSIFGSVFASWLRR